MCLGTKFRICKRVHSKKVSLSCCCPGVNNFSFPEAIATQWLPRWLSGKESTCQCRGCRFDRWVRKILREENGNPLRCSCLGNPTDRAWWASVHGVTRVRHDIATKRTTKTTNCCIHSMYFFSQFYTSDRIITTILHIVFFTHQSILIPEYIWAVSFFFSGCIIIH